MEPRWHEGRNAFNPRVLALELLPGGSRGTERQAHSPSKHRAPSPFTKQKAGSSTGDTAALPHCDVQAQPEQLPEAQWCLRTHPEPSLPTATLPAAQNLQSPAQTPAQLVPDITTVPQHILLQACSAAKGDPQTGSCDISGCCLQHSE